MYNIRPGPARLHNIRPGREKSGPMAGRLLCKKIRPECRPGFMQENPAGNRANGVMKLMR